MDFRFRLTGIVMVAMLLGLVSHSAQGQAKKKGIAQPGKIEPNKPADPPSSLRTAFSAQVSLPTNPDLERKLKAIPEYIEAKLWKDVTQALQEILDAPEDCFLPRDAKEGTQWVSARAEANRMLGTLPAEGRQLYEVMSGVTADSLLKEAKEKGDIQKLADVGLRYFHTRAGAEALDLLGTHNLDRGQYIPAMICYDRLLARPEADKLPPMTLFKAALAFQRYGDRARSAELWKTLSEKAKDGIMFGERKATLADLKQVLDQPVVQAGALAAGDWNMPRGNPSRTALAATNPLDARELSKTWTSATAEHVYSKSWLENAAQQLYSRSQPVIPGFTPLVMGDKAVFRSHSAVHAFSLKTGELLWKTCGLGFGLDSVGPDATGNIYPHVSNWVSTYMSNAPSMLLENAALGTISSDGAFIFAVEDLAVPPYPQNIFNPNLGIAIRPVNPHQNIYSEALSKAAQQNLLFAVEVKTGRTMWDVGGPDNPGPLSGGYFLGPPLPLGGKLYCLFEKEAELKLVCLDPSRKGELVWSQPLVYYKKTLQQDVGRRTWSAPLAYDQGILVCPSNSGAVVGVDMLTHSLVWAHPYLSEQKQPEVVQPLIGRRKLPIGGRIPAVPPKMAASWKVAGPLLADGKVILTAPDSGDLRCLNIRDGSLLWKKDKLSDDHFIAGVHQNRVLIVGQNQVRALNLKDGTQAWQATTGIPSGHGVAAGKVYYLPLRSGLDQNPGIVGINLDNGQIVARIKTPNLEVPGNLVLANDRIVSQTATAVTTYSLVK